MDKEMIHFIPKVVAERNIEEALSYMMALAKMDLIDGEGQITFKFIEDYEIEAGERYVRLNG
jgi:hypothetical protein